MKTPCVLLFTLVLLTAGSGLAQPQSSPTAELLSPEASPSSALAPQPEETEPEEPGFFGRMGIGTLGGIGGGLVGAGAGALTGYGLARLSDPEGCASEFQRTCSGGRLAGVLVGAAIGVPAGTYLARAMTGGQGTYVYALFGNLLAGLVAGWGIAAVVDFSDNDSVTDGAIMAGFLMLPALGSALLYEHSHAQALGTSLRPTGLRYSSAARVSLEVLYGIVGGLMVGVVGFVGGMAAGGCEFPDGCGDSAEQVVADSTFILGAVLGSSLGVYAAGRQTLGRGSFIPVLAGSTLGAVTGTLGFAMDPDAGVPVMLLGSLVGAFIGYEASHKFTPPPPGATLARRSPVKFQVLPVISATPAGGLFGGLAGTF
jgi:hypothetical protein